MTDGDNVVPFAERRPKGPPPPTTTPVDHLLSSRTRRAAPEARMLAAEQNADQRAGYAKAVTAQQFERERSPTPVPARIKIALDLRELYGPEVDLACGVDEAAAHATPSAVDLWETGDLVPTDEQVKLLAELTGFPERYFYLRIEPGTRRSFMCGSRGLTVVTETVDERGVLTVTFDEQPRRRKREPKPKDAQPPNPNEPHRFKKDPQTPKVCKWCEMPEANRRRHPR